MKQKHWQLVKVTTVLLHGKSDQSDFLKYPELVFERDFIGNNKSLAQHVLSS